MSPGVDGWLMRPTWGLIGVVSRSDENFGVSLRLLEQHYDSKGVLRKQRCSDYSRGLMGNVHAFKCNIIVKTDFLELTYLGDFLHSGSTAEDWRSYGEIEVLETRSCWDA